jgi:glycosyltransferase involved in cell wall biosynthesis
MNKKTKILYLTTTSLLSGAEKQLYELAKGIDKKRCEIMVCTVRDNLEGQLLNKLKEDDIKTECLEVSKKWEIWKLFKLIKVIKSFQPDILQSFLFFDNILARVFGKICGAPIIISGQRNVETHRSRLRNFLDKITLPLADYVVSNSKAGKEILVEREKVSEAKIKVIYNGIDVKSQKNSEKYAEKRGNLNIGFVGSLTKQKGVDCLLKAVKILRFTQNDKWANINLTIIGDGPEREKLEKTAKELDIEKHVSFLGRKESVYNHMKDFDVFVLPSLWEGMPNVILEAIMQEVPVVATNVGGIPEIITNGKDGFLVEAKNTEALAEKIEYVLSLPEEERKKIEENAKKIVEEKFSIEKMIKEYENLYREILKK